jgi:hypothetical protein
VRRPGSGSCPSRGPLALDGFTRGVVRLISFQMCGSSTSGLIWAPRTAAPGATSPSADASAIGWIAGIAVLHRGHSARRIGTAATRRHRSLAITTLWGSSRCACKTVLVMSQAIAAAGGRDAG